MSTVRVGLIGCGVMGRSLVKGCKELEHVEIAAASDPNEDAVGKLAEETGARPFADYRKLLRAGDIQAVIVASPPFLHRQMTEDAARAGLHVFCEKPMAPTKADCLKMIEACKKNNVKLMIGQVCRFHPVHSRVKEIVQSGDLGRTLCMIVRRLGGGFGGVWDVEWRRKRNTSGGALMEINAHEIDFMRWVCGDVERVSAVGVENPHADIDFPGAVLLTMVFRSGAVGLLHSSQISAVGAYGGRVDCEKGSLDFSAFWGPSAGINMAGTDGSTKFIPASDIKVETPVTHELRVFFDSIVNDTVPPVPGEEGMAAVEIAEAAYLSVETAVPVKLPLA